MRWTPPCSRTPRPPGTEGATLAGAAPRSITRAPPGPLRAVPETTHDHPARRPGPGAEPPQGRRLRRHLPQRRLSRRLLGLPAGHRGVRGRGDADRRAPAAAGPFLHRLLRDPGPRPDGAGRQRRRRLQRLGRALPHRPGGGGHRAGRRGRGAAQPRPPGPCRRPDAARQGGVPEGRGDHQRGRRETSGATIPSRRRPATSSSCSPRPAWRSTPTATGSGSRRRARCCPTSR